MPELPEVETVRRELESKIIGHKIIDVNTDWPRICRNIDYRSFKKRVSGLTIEKIERKGKFLFFKLSGNQTIVAHLRMTGHFIVSSCWNFNGKNIKRENRPDCKDKESDLFDDKKNTFIHLSLTLSKHRNLLFSDVRKFGTIDLIKESELLEYRDKIGIDALDENLKLQDFIKKISNKKQEIKRVLLDQTVISGIGNIYADEILFESNISPLRTANNLTTSEVKKLFRSIKKVINKAISFGGTSFSDFRNTDGKKGNFGLKTKVYQKKDLACPKKCGGSIKRIKIAGRGTYFCPLCQK